MRNPSREPRRYANHRSRSCDSSRSRHYYVSQRTPSNSVISKYTKRQRSRDVSVEYSDRYVTKKTTKRPHRRQEESISVKRKHRKISRTDSTIQRSRKSSYVREKAVKHHGKSSKNSKYNPNYKQRSSSSPRRQNAAVAPASWHNNQRRRRRHSDPSCSHSSSDDGYRSLEVAKPPKCDAEGHLVYKKGELVQGRYELLMTLGEGAFGRVIKCLDHERHGRKVALKVIKNVQKYREEAKLEIKVLETIMEKDRKGRSGCIYLLDWFNFHGFMCLAFDMLGKSIYDFLKDNQYYPYPRRHIKKMAYQLGNAVKFLHDHGMTHTDLKPENILFIDSSYEIMWNVEKDRDEKILRNCDIKLIDFGSTTFDDEHHTKIVQTRHYRAPEVILELGWCQSCDVWSVGCILFELYTGETMFLTHDNHEHLAMMTYILGRLPSSMIKRSKKSKYFYHGRLNWDFDERNSSNKYIKQHCKPLSRCLRHRSEEDELLMELIWDCLKYDPEQRLSMSQYLKHDYLTYEPKQSAPPATPPPPTCSSSSSSATQKQSQSKAKSPHTSSSSSRHRNNNKKSNARTPPTSNRASPSPADPVTSTSRSRVSSPSTRRKANDSSDRD